MAPFLAATIASMISFQVVISNPVAAYAKDRYAANAFEVARRCALKD
jgi:hypothetical protein